MPEMYTKQEEEQDHPWTSRRRGHLLGGYKVFPLMSVAPGQGNLQVQWCLSASALNLSHQSDFTFTL